MDASKIHQLYAFVAIAPDGNEGIVWSWVSSRLLIAWNLEGIDEMRPEAEQAARDNGVKIQLRKFTSMELLEVIGG